MGNIIVESYYTQKAFDLIYDRGDICFSSSVKMSHKPLHFTNTDVVNYTLTLHSQTQNRKNTDFDTNFKT